MLKESFQCAGLSDRGYGLVCRIEMFRLPIEIPAPNDEGMCVVVAVMMQMIKIRVPRKQKNVSQPDERGA